MKRTVMMLLTIALIAVLGACAVAEGMTEYVTKDGAKVYADWDTDSKVIAKLSKGDKVKIGVIGSISNLNIARTPKVGEHLVTTIKLLEEVFQVTLVEAIVKSDDEVLAQCNMKIALTDMDSKD